MMMTYKQMTFASGLILSSALFAGCGGAKEIGPADASKVPVVDSAVLQKEINRDEAKAHMPKGVKMPANVMPADEPGK